MNTANVISNARSDSRKRYSKPSIEQVRLVTDEAVLVVCKTSEAGTGPVEACGFPAVACLGTS